MRKSSTIVVVIGVLALVGALLGHQLTETPTTTNPALAISSPVEEAAREKGLGTPPPVTPLGITANAVDNPATATVDYESRFRAATDIWQFAETLHPAAKSGDPAAQYYLSRALKYCESEYRFYFIRPNKKRTLDEAMQWASTRVGLKAEDARRVFERCSRLRETAHPFGTPAEWLAASTENGFDLAIMESATQLMLDARGAEFPAQGSMLEKAKRMALQALRSKNPEVVFNMDDLVYLFADAEKGLDNMWVWRLAGCLRGYECGQDSEWYQAFCRFDSNCQPYESGVDYIRRANSESFDEIERRAVLLNARLDANYFEWFDDDQAADSPLSK